MHNDCEMTRCAFIHWCGETLSLLRSLSSCVVGQFRGVSVARHTGLYTSARLLSTPRLAQYNNSAFIAAPSFPPLSAAIIAVVAAVPRVPEAPT